MACISFIGVIIPSILILDELGMDLANWIEAQGYMAVQVPLLCTPRLSWGRALGDTLPKTSCSRCRTRFSWPQRGGPPSDLWISPSSRCRGDKREDASRSIVNQTSMTLRMSFLPGGVPARGFLKRVIPKADLPGLHDSTRDLSPCPSG
jgi:hypothetical protein